MDKVFCRIVSHAVKTYIQNVIRTSFIVISWFSTPLTKMFHSTETVYNPLVI